ncbi:MAG: DNA translocase FtsK [Prevotella sp.]|nr:DNA translocase FtsK [Prevotella sp.]
MAKKKKQNNNTSFMEAVGAKNLFQNEKINFILGVVIFAVAIYLILSFVSFFSTGAADQTLIESPRDGEMSNQNGEFANSCGSLGAYTAYFFIKQCFGLPAFIIPLFLILLSLRMMKAYTNVNLLKWFMVLAIIMVWLSVTFAKFLAPFFIDSSFSPGGDHGLFICQQIEGYLGSPGLTAVLALIAIGFLTYISAETIYFIRKILNPSKIFNRVKFTIHDTSNKKDEDTEQPNNPEEPLVFDNPYTETVEWNTKDNQHDEKTSVSQDVGVKKETPTTSAEEVGMEVTIAKSEATASGTNVRGSIDTPYDPKLELEHYRYPTLDLLKKYEDDGKPYIDMQEQNANKNRIVEVLRNFGIEIDAIKATVGPTITLYEITPAQGVRISKIRNLEDDIALSLKAMGIRIIAPIPGKGTIGIEVPNAKASIVSMESVLNSKKFQETTMDLPCAMGKTITNEVFMFDLAKMPHLLVAGATGQGKSVGLNAILTSLLYKKHPAELKIVLVDPKMVEFSIYSNIDKHFLAKVPDDSASPIITDTTKVVRTLNSLCVEMDARYELLMAAGERNIKDYNKKFIARQLSPEKGHKYMPYIVVVIDEYGDLIMTAGKEIELPIARIAQKARAVGIHMIIATQRPTTNIITGTIKANFPARIAFKVAQGIDSKTILDRMGANQLIGRGDMLFLQGNDPIRVQCAFVDTPEVVAINNFIAEQQGYATTFELPEPTNDSEGEYGGGNDVDLNHLDPLFEDAAHHIVMSQSGSTSLIQRKFAIGYNRAGRLMDQLEKAGIVGAAMGSKPREVLIQDEVSLENLISQLK